MQKKLLATKASTIITTIKNQIMRDSLPTTHNVAKINNTEYPTLQEAVDAANDGDTILIIKNIEYTNENAFSNGIWFDGIKYTGDKDFIIDLNGKTISANNTLNNYLLYFKNNGMKANKITLKNGSICGGTNLLSVICVGSITSKYTTEMNFGEDIIIEGNSADPSAEDCVAKSRYGSSINVLNGSTIISNKSLFGLRAGTDIIDRTATINIYDGALVEMKHPDGAAIIGTGIINIYGGIITGKINVPASKDDSLSC